MLIVTVCVCVCARACVCKDENVPNSDLTDQQRTSESHQPNTGMLCSTDNLASCMD